MKLPKYKIKKITRRWMNKQDKIWSKLIKDKFDNKCFICGDDKMLSSHHIISRKVKETRWHLYNGIALCPKHHKFSIYMSAHQNPLLFYNVYLGKYGLEIYCLIKFLQKYNDEDEIKTFKY